MLLAFLSKIYSIARPKLFDRICIDWKFDIHAKSGSLSLFLKEHILILLLLKYSIRARVFNDGFHIR